MYKIIRIKLTIHPPNQYCGKVVQAINDKNQQQKNKHKDKQNNEEIKVVHKWTMFSSLTHINAWLQIQLAFLQLSKKHITRPQTSQ